MEEEGQLLCAIEGLAQDGKSDMSAQGFWVSVLKAMGATWTPKQCQSKWCVLCSFIILLCPCDSAGLTPSKGKHKTKIRCSIGKKMTATFLFASACHVLLILCWLTTKYIGSLLSMSMMKMTLTGSPSMILRGTCGVAITFSKNGDN